MTRAGAVLIGQLIAIAIMFLASLALHGCDGR